MDTVRTAHSETRQRASTRHCVGTKGHYQRFAVSLTTCPDCGTPVSSEAVACPKCGRQAGRKRSRAIAVVLALLLGGLAAVLNFYVAHKGTSGLGGATYRRAVHSGQRSKSHSSMTCAQTAKLKATRKSRSCEVPVKATCSQNKVRLTLNIPATTSDLTATGI